jgi:Fe-S-cluster-containing dehydrogenase component
LGAVSLTILPAWGGNDDDASTNEDTPNFDAKQTPRYGFLIDSDKCIGTGKCLTACRIENNVPEGDHRTWVERYVHFKDGTIQVDTVPETGYAGSGLPIIDSDKVDRAYFVPKMCNHCDDAPCNQVCPVHASFTSPEGVELIDTERCIGCAYCVQACPYGVRFINSETGTADKCTWCYHRVTQGEQPACVEACPVGARLFGRIDDPNSEISKRIAMIPTHVLKEHLGTHPKTRYIGITNEVT